MPDNGIRTIANGQLLNRQPPRSVVVNGYTVHYILL